MRKRLVPLSTALLLALVPATAWAAANGGTVASAAPLPSASAGGTAYGSVPLPKHPRKRRKRRVPAPAPTRAPQAPITPSPTATLTGSTALAPSDAPAAVKLAIAAGNQLQTFPYRFGGGHASFKDTAYDCSGTVSYMLHGAGLIAGPLDSTSFMSWGLPGPGRWITIYANAGHAYAVVAGLRLDTSGTPSGPRWRALPRSGAGFTVRHPPGF